MNKAIIVEVSNRHLIVLGEGGEFKKIKNTNPSYTIGQEIMLPVKNERKSSIFSVLINWKTGTAAVLAIILLFFQVLSPLSGPGAYAYVGMDMDPSLELKINEEFEVLHIFAFNEQGHEVLDQMDAWENKDIAYVTNLIFETCEELGYLKAKEEVLITTTLSEEIPENKEMEMKERVNEVMIETAKKKSVEMTTIVMSSKEREKAKKMKISPGHYAIYTAAKKSGIKISKNEISGKTIEEISEKVGPIKELLDEENESSTASKNQNEENLVYEPPVPILDQKEKTEQTGPVSPAPEKEQQSSKEKRSETPVSKAVIPAAPKKEDKHAAPVKKEEEVTSVPEIAHVPEKTATEKPPIKDAPVTIQPKEEKPKEEKPEKPKEEKPKEVDPPPHTAEPVEKDPEISPEPKDNWIYIEIVIDGIVIKLKVKTDSQLLKEELTKQALAIINQRQIKINESVTASYQELNQPHSMDVAVPQPSLEDQEKPENSNCEKVITQSPVENALKSAS